MMKARILRMITVFLTLVAGQLSISVVQAQQLSALPDEQMIADSYVYLLGRALVIRQEQLDISEEGRQYNVAHHNPLADVTFINPNLSVTNTQAWIAVDEQTPVIVEIRKIEGRYYTAQICDEWDEVITNINERNYPLHPYGKFAFVAPGSQVVVPSDAVKIQLRSPKAKMLARVEIQDDPAGAIVLQRQIKVAPLGNPKITPAINMPMFKNDTLIGIEIFDNADEILTSAPDISPVAAQLQAKVRVVSAMAKNPMHRGELNQLLKKKIIPNFLKWSVTESGVVRNNWVGTLVIVNYGEDFRIRTAANLVGIWANARTEVIYFVTTRDAKGDPLNGGNDYVMNFPKDARPEGVVGAFWSVTLVGLPDFLPVRNSLDRYNLNTWSAAQNESDGTLRILLSPKAGHGIPEANRLPTAEGQPFSLTFRTYVPNDSVLKGEWFPPAVEKIVD
jgi:hypothetical protein